MDLSEKLQKVYDPHYRRENEQKWWNMWKETGKKPDQIKLWDLNDMYDYNNSIYFDVAAAYLED